MISELIIKKDTFELVRDKIASILALEFANQRALAVASGRDPSLWEADIYVERTNPWEQFLNEETAVTPIINIWYERSSFNKSGGDVFERQTADAVFNIDCVGFGISSSTSAGHTPGDLAASNELQRVIRLVRNIIMAAEYTYLDMRGVVGNRWVSSVTPFQAQFDSSTAQQIAGGRVVLDVSFNELSPQVEAVALETILGQIDVLSNGQVVTTVNAEWDYKT